MTAELVVSPSDQHVRVSLAEALAWSAYAADLRRLLGVVVEQCGVDRLEVTELLVSQPLPVRYGGLRNGVQVNPVEAINLAERMAAGFGPYCRLVAPGRLRVESGWDGAIHLSMDPAAANSLTGLAGDSLFLEWRASEPDPEEELGRVDDVVDDEFWNSVRVAADGLVLLCERWAHGAHGCRWFRVTEGMWRGWHRVYGLAHSYVLSQTRTCGLTRANWRRISPRSKLRSRLAGLFTALTREGPTVFPK
ncbi:hypothetical protein [Streptomyces cucumeris]|uniref:hypothetical protein n=1 Tax=Streptomyces cucumeris TaxID=2962890 RepID=UPI0020C91770|nr:hypothetical protein [Streptomyces sp. NEAU-Y11]MCP9205961.1 hypothetical protein [Streptomyces sp. NEAU-Y11]